MTQGRFHGSFRMNRRRGLELLLDPATRRARRVQRILASIQQDLDNGGTASVRRIHLGPRELYRLELELPDMAYQRTTILDGETLAALLESTGETGIRDRFRFSR